MSRNVIKFKWLRAKTIVENILKLVLTFPIENVVSSSRRRKVIKICMDSFLTGAIRAKMIAVNSRCCQTFS